MKAGKQNWNEYVFSCLLPNQLRSPAKVPYGPHQDNQLADINSF